MTAKLILALALVLASCGMTTLAWAAEAATQQQTWWQAVLVFLINAIAIVVTPVLTALGYMAAKKWKLGVDRDTLEWVVSKAAGFGEQKAKVALKDGHPMKGPDILKLSLDKGTELLEKKGLLKKWGDQLGDLVEAKLGEQELAKPDRSSKTAESNTPVLKDDTAKHANQEG